MEGVSLELEDEHRMTPLISYACFLLQSQKCYFLFLILFFHKGGELAQVPHHPFNIPKLMDTVHGDSSRLGITLLPLFDLTITR